MSDRIVAHTLIRMTLAYFRTNGTHLKKINGKSSYLGDYFSYSDVIGTVIQLAMVLPGR